MEIFDYRTDLRNVLITPEIRSRFLRIAAGETTRSHTHDLGVEVFLVLDGEIEFEIAGERAVLGPGQMTVARVDEPHTLTALHGQPATIYLSVTPHVEPTHTFWSESGERQPPVYGGSTANERAGESHDPATIVALAREHLAAARALADAAATSARLQAAAVAALESALGVSDREAVKSAIDAMWDGVGPAHAAAARLGAAWNELAARATES